MCKLFTGGREWCNLAPCRGLLLLAVVTMLVGPAWADEATSQPGQQTVDTSKPNAAAPSVAWGKAEAGLRCSASLPRSDFRVGDPFEVQIQIQNVSEKELTFDYPPDYRTELLEIRDEQGKPVQKAMTADTEGWMDRKPFVTLQPAEVFSASFVGRTRFRLPWSQTAEHLPPVLEIDFHDDGMRHALVHPGKFTVSMHLTADEKTAARAGREGIAALWQGDLSSPAVPFQVKAASREELDAALHDLHAGTPAKQRQAIELLDAHVDGKAVPGLVEILLHGSSELRVSAQAALSALRDRSIVPELLAHYRQATSPQMRRSLLMVIQSSSD